MPEHDFTKHGKEIVNTIKEPGKNWKEKLGDILIDVAIIVFGITLSLMVERWRENVHERSIEKKFLLGLRVDLQNDIQQLKDDSTSYDAMYNKMRSCEEWIEWRSLQTNVGFEFGSIERSIEV